MHIFPQITQYYYAKYIIQKEGSFIMLFASKEGEEGLKSDFAKLLKEEGSLVKELSQVATEAAGLHARLEAIEKAFKTAPSSYQPKEADALAQKAKDKYTNELEGSMKNNAMDKMK